MTTTANDCYIMFAVQLKPETAARSIFDTSDDALASDIADMLGHEVAIRNDTPLTDDGDIDLYTIVAGVKAIALTEMEVSV